MRVRPASYARLPPRSRATATAPIPTAAMGTTQPRTRATDLNMGLRPSLLSRASSAVAVAAAVLLAAQLPLQGRHRPPQAVGQTVPLCTANVVAKGGLGRLAALLGPARLPTLTTRNACRWTVERHGTRFYHSCVYSGFKMYIFCPKVLMIYTCMILFPNRLSILPNQALCALVSL